MYACCTLLIPVYQWSIYCLCSWVSGLDNGQMMHMNAINTHFMLVGNLVSLPLNCSVWYSSLSVHFSSSCVGLCPASQDTQLAVNQQPSYCVELHVSSHHKTLTNQLWINIFLSYYHTTTICDVIVLFSCSLYSCNFLQLLVWWLLGNGKWATFAGIK